MKQTIKLGSWNIKITSINSKDIDPKWFGGADVGGYCDVKNKTIFINEDCLENPEEVEELICHELIHMALAFMGDDKRFHDEIYITTLSHLLLPLIKDWKNIIDLK